MTDEARIIDARSLWLKWVAGNAVGMAAGQIGGIAIGITLGGLIAQMGAAELASIIAFVITPGVVTGVSMGVTQRIFLQQEISLERRWVWGNTVGWTIGYMVATPAASLLSTVVEPALATSLSWGLISLAIGLAQWRVLRDRFPHAALWIPANVAGWMIGPVFAGIVVLTFLGSGIDDQSAQIATLASAALTGAVAGAVTGFVLVRLLREAGQQA
jgi:hypothetical protein